MLCSVSARSSFMDRVVLSYWWVGNRGYAAGVFFCVIVEIHGF